MSDTTYFKLKDQYHYICVIMDLSSRKIIAHKVSQKHSTQLITGTFRSAYKKRKPGCDLIFHSDRGCQYTAYACRKLLKACNVNESFSPTRKPHHNAVMESFFSSMKKEELYRASYHSVGEFKERIDRYIRFYSDERPHVALDYKTPHTHEQLFCKRNKLTELDTAVQK